MKKVFLITGGLIMLASPALAEKAAIRSLVPGSNCRGGMQENVTLSVNFNMKAKSFAEAKTKFDEKMKQMDEFAKQKNIGKFELQSMNYSINSQLSYDGGLPEQVYQLSGNGSYNLDSADSAFNLAEFLTSQKIQANVSVNQYRNANCNNPTVQ